MQASKSAVRAVTALAGPRLLGPRLTARQLSMTGSTSSSSLLTSDKPYASNRPSTPVRLSGETANVIHVPEASETGSKVRHFNTSRSLKAVNDTSTIDFAFIPDFNAELKSESEGLRVPIMPWSEASAMVGATEREEPVIQPTIYTVAADGTHVHAPSAMSEITDSNQLDYQGMADTVTNTFTSTRQEGEGMVRQILTGLMDDILGPKRGSPRA